VTAWLAASVICSLYVGGELGALLQRYSDRQKRKAMESHSRRIARKYTDQHGG
jgi:hypothetical protein